ncbi:helix-turn-helix domain-containing protein [Haloechinothrix sp. LS1_15]|uniref:TetR/AcrR family transcriptional regulator n=1 Tax=Haloechinothrix sp. LS1_15 TaxID=2652248 RepID=UPI00294B07DF|nr:helix-turn-helix domain-containing protein [Haloechinothrix sp. LS1_15]
MPRMTRYEQRARNRGLLLAAARERFLRDGYLNTSIATVAADAGFSTGVVYSNFGSKAELALLVLRRIQAERLDELAVLLDGDRLLEAKLDALRGWAERAMNSGWPRFELEFALEARADARLITAEAQRQRSAVELIADALAAQVPGADPAGAWSRAMATSVVDVAIGVAVRRLIDPDTTVDSLIELVRAALTEPGTAVTRSQHPGYAPVISMDSPSRGN